MWYSTSPDAHYTLSVIASCLVGNRLGVALSVLPVWEYLITFDREVNAVWQRKFTLSSGLILLNRWCMVFQGLFNSIGPGSPQAISALSPGGDEASVILSACVGIILTEEALATVGFILTSVISALRVFALYDQNYRLLALIMAPCVVTVSLSVFCAAHFQYSYIGSPLYTCMAEVNLSSKANRIIILVTRIPVLCADALVLLLTWSKTYRHLKYARQSHLHTPIAAAITRDGTLYFGSVFLVHAIQLAIIFTEPDALRLGGTLIGAFVYVLPQVLINRFMLNLRRIDKNLSFPSVDAEDDLCPIEFRAVELTTRDTAMD